MRPAPVAPHTESEAAIGRRVGTIRIVGVLGQGGVGEVFEGWDEHLERRVALKAVRHDRPSDSARARLLREARILSRLDDPKICQIYDYLEGEEHGWLVLERVDGEPLSRVDWRQVSRAQKLGIVQQIAEVLVETHAKGIIHRDLKPSNIMLDAAGSVKVLDFGIARWVEDAAVTVDGLRSAGASMPLGPLPPGDPHSADHHGADHHGPDHHGVDHHGPDHHRADAETHALPAAGTGRAGEVRTQLGQVLGTIRYMSPEQARGEAVTAASDLYSLGLIVREILTGEPPYPTDEPPLVTLTRVAKGDRPDPYAGEPVLEEPFARWVDGLTQPEARHRPSAAALVRQVDHERGRPRRRRRRLAVASLASTALLAGLFYVLELRATMVASIDARAAAEEARDEAEALSSFLVGLFDRPTDGTGSPPTARSILERGADRLDAVFGRRPRTHAQVAFDLGEVYQSLGDYPRSRRLHGLSLELREGLDPPEPLAVAASLDALGSDHRFEGDYDLAATYFRRALALREELLGPWHEEVSSSLNGLAIVERRRGRYDEAEAHYLRALEIRRRVLGPNDLSVAKGLNNLALLYYYQARLDEAETLYRQAMEIKERVLEPNHPSIAHGLNNLANLLADQERYDEAEALYRRSVTIWEATAGPDHPDGASSVNNLGLLLHEAGRWDEAETYLHRALTIRSKALGDDHPDVASALSNLGSLYTGWRRFDEAEERLRRALAIYDTALGSDSVASTLTLDRLAQVELGRGRVADARSWVERSLAINLEHHGEQHPDTALSTTLVALCDLGDGEPNVARLRLEQAIAVYDAVGQRGYRLRDARSALELTSSGLSGVELRDAISRRVAPGQPGS